MNKNSVEINNVYEKINNTFIGRDNEIDIIKDQFDYVLEGKSSTILVVGNRGIGKTFLVEYMIKELKSSNITYIYEKSREHEKKPFIVMSGIIKQMIKHLLTLPYDQLKPVKSKLINNLDFDVAVMVYICPYAKKLLGNSKSIENLKYENLKYKIRKILNVFFSVTSELLFPLVIFIDDIHWIDNASLDIIKDIRKNNEFINIMIIAAIRENEIYRIENVIKINEIEEKNKRVVLKLNKLLKIDVKNYILTIFGKNIENIDYLCRFIFGLTLGNPFYVREIIEIFIQENIIEYSNVMGKWIVRITNMNNVAIPTDIEQVVTNKMNRLSEVNNEILECIACLDGKVEYVFLRKIMKIDEIILKEQLQKLCDATFLVIEEDDFQEIKEINYVFTHDIIYELVYKNIDRKKKAKMHYRIAKLYLELESLNIKIDKFLLVSQLLRSDYDLIIKENSSRWISILFENGIEEKQIPDIERALEIFKFCESILPYSSAEIENEFKVKLNIEIGECDFFCERYDEAEKRFELLIMNCDSFDCLISIKINYMNLYLYKGHFNKVLSLGKEILEKLQFSVESQSIVFNLIKMRFLYSDRNIETRKKLSEIDDNRILMILEVLSIMIPAASNIDNKLFLKILISITNLTAKYGESEYSLLGYAACSLIYYNVWNDYNKGKKIENKLQELLEVNREESTKSLVYLAIGTFLSHRTSPIENSIGFLEKGIIEGARTSKFSYSGYSIISLTYIKYIIGIPLNEIRSYIIEQIEISKKIGESSEAFIEYVFNKHIECLVNGVISYKPKEKNEVMNAEVIENLMKQVFTIQRYYLEGKIVEAYEITNEIDKNIFYLVGHIIYLDAIFYCLIIRITIYDELEDKVYNKKQIDKLMKIFKHQMAKYEYNYYAHYLLIKAKYADVFEEKKFSEKYFNESILVARERGYLHIEGIGNLFAARYYKYNEKLSKYYVGEALNLFKKWGALYICSLIEEEFNIQKKSNEVINEKIDLLTYESEDNILDNLDEIDLMSEEDGFSYILNYFSKKYHIHYCAILVEKIDEMYLQFERKGDNKVIIHKELIRMKHVSYLSRKIIRYVARTGEEINLNRNQNNDLFSKDLYILGKKELSILCIPIEYFGVFVGMVYFEKNTNDGFSKKISQSIRTIIPILMSKSEIVKNINRKNIINSSEFEALLTDREKDVLKLVAKGMSNSAISKELFIALGTVKNHLSNIYSKLEVDSRLKAVIKANEMNIIDV